MVRIITDSAADFAPAELQAMNIICIPLSVTFGDDTYIENETLSKDQFYALLEETHLFPKTSQPALQSVLDQYEAAEEAGDEIVHITLSSAISGTCQTAMSAKSMVDYDGIYVVDSKNATGGERLLVEQAVKLRDQGCSAAEITQAIEALREKVVLVAVIDTLEYLYKGGRISRTSYALGSMAQIKPIIRFNEEGALEVPAKAMGLRKGLDIVCKKLDARNPDLNYPIYVMYGHNRAGGETLAQRVRDLGYPVEDRCIVNVGAAIGSHVGANCFGIVYVAAE